MLDFAMGGPGGPGQSIYFQFIPTQLIYTGSSQPGSDQSYRMVMYKGLQKFDDNKTYVPVAFHGKKMPLNGISLNFFLPNYNPSRKVQYTVKLMLNDNSQEHEVGSLIIDSGKFVQIYKQEKRNHIVKENQSISSQYSLSYQIFIQKNRFNLDKLVKQTKGAPTTQTKVQQKKNKVFASENIAPQTSFQQNKESPKKSKRFQRTSSDIDETAQIQNQVIQVKQEQAPTYSRKIKQPSQTSSRKRQNSYTTHSKAGQDSKPSKTKLKRTSSGQESLKIVTNESRSKILHHQGSVMKGSRHLGQAIKEEQQQMKNAKKSQQSSPKYIIKMAIFLILSLFMIWNAMTPSKAYNSHRRRH